MIATESVKFVSAPVSQQRRSVTAALVALFLAAMDSTVVGTLLPVIKNEMHDKVYYPWLLSGFLLTMIVASPIAGKLADQLGEKLAMQAALVLFMIGSLAVYAAPTMAALVWARALQGAGAGAVMVMTYVIVGYLHDDESRGKMQGLLSTVWGIAAILGPIAGAAMHATVGWRFIFAINVPLVLAAIAFFSAAYPGTRRQQRGRRNLDSATLLGFTATLGGLLLLIMSPSFGWNFGAKLWLGALTLAGLLGQVLRIWPKRERSIFPLVFVSTRTLGFSALLTMLSGMALYASVTLLPLWLQGTGAVSAYRSGIVIMVAAVAWVIGSALSGALVIRRGYRAMGAVGALCLIGGVAFLALPSGELLLPIAGAAQVLIGLGIGFATTATLVLVQNTAPLSEIGSYTSAIQLCRNVGAALGVNTVAMLQMSQQRALGAVSGTHPETFQFAFRALLLLTLFTLPLALMLPRRVTRAL